MGARSLCVCVCVFCRVAAECGFMWEQGCSRLVGEGRPRGLWRGFEDRPAGLTHPVLRHRHRFVLCRMGGSRLTTEFRG